MAVTLSAGPSAPPKACWIFSRVMSRLTVVVDLLPASSFADISKAAGCYSHRKKRTARKPKTAAQPARTSSDVAEGKVPCIEV